MKLDRVAGRVVRRVVCASVLVALAGSAMAEPPAVLDRVPQGAAIVVTLRNIEQAQSKLLDIAKLVGQEEALAGGPMGEIEAISQTPGLNKSGSLAIAIMAGPDGMNLEDQDGPVIIIAPVSDYAAFVKGLGGVSGPGLSEVKLDEQAGFVKDLGGGFAALSPKKDLLEAYSGKAGQSAEHAKSYGKTGAGIADRADVIIITNIPALQKQINQGIGQMKDQAKNATAMMGPQGAQAEAGLAIFQTIAENWSRDGERAIVGLSKTDKGIAIDIASNFKQGSELSKFFMDSGKSAALVNKVPNQPFLFAGALDVSSPGLKQIGKNMGKMAADQAKAADGASSDLPMQQFVRSIENASGFSFCVGANPAAMMGGGLFTNTTYYIATSDPKTYISSAKAALAEANGKKQGPVTTKTSYESEAQDIKGIKADKWSSKMEFDPNDPMAMQAQMMTGMMFGPSGLGGYTAAVGDGVVSVMSPNTPLMEMAIDAAKTGKGLGDEPSLKDVQSGLPGNRFMEFYVGSKSIFDSIGGFMAMMGGGQNFKTPEKLSPVAIAGTSEAGGVNFHIFVPSDVIQTVAEIAKTMQSPDEGEEEMDAPADEKPAKAPRF